MRIGYTSRGEVGVVWGDYGEEKLEVSCIVDGCKEFTLVPCVENPNFGRWFYLDLRRWSGVLRTVLDRGPLGGGEERWGRVRDSGDSPTVSENPIQSSRGGVPDTRTTTMTVLVTGGLGSCRESGEVDLLGRDRERRGAGLLDGGRQTEGGRRPRTVWSLSGRRPF